MTDSFILRLLRKLYLAVIHSSKQKINRKMAFMRLNKCFWWKLTAVLDMEKPMSFLEFQRIFLRYIYSKYVLNEELSTINIRTDYIAMSFKSIVSDFFFLPKPLSKATNK